MFTIATTYRLPSGKTRVVVRLKGVYKSASFDRATDARRWATEQEAAILSAHHGIKQKVGAQTLGDLIKQYTEQTPKRGVTTTEQREFWIKTFGAQPLKLLDSAFARSIATTYMTRGAQSPHAIKMIRGIARVVTWGRRSLNLDISPEPLLTVAENMKFEGHAVRYAPRKTIMTEDELDTFVKHFEEHGRKDDFPALLRFLAASGMRVGEAISIVGRDVNLEARTVIVRKRKHPTRKATNDQEVPLIGEAWDLIKAKVEAGETGVLFPVTNPSARFSYASKRLGLEHCRLHDLRRLFVSRCYAAGLPPHIVQIATGHGLGVLMAHYSNLGPADFHRRYDNA